MTAARYFSVATSVTVDHDTPPRVFRSEEFGIAFVIISNGAGAEVALNAASLEAMLAWLGEAARAVGAMVAPVLPLDDVLSTHPEPAPGVRDVENVYAGSPTGQKPPGFGHLPTHPAEVTG